MDGGMALAEKELRLDKYLADMKVGTRSEVKIFIRKSRITVNGITVRNTGFKVTEQDIVAFDGREVGYTKMEYIMLNKPAGVLTATKDSRQKTVLSLLPKAKRRDLFPVGRLDKDTEGLLLITNDGILAHRLLSPKKHVDKTYFVRVAGCVNEEHKNMFAAGILCGDFTALPAELVIKKTGDISEVLLTIREGKFHQVKRMFEAVGMEVLYLKRIRMGTLSLDGNLKEGEYRELTEEEVKKLRCLTGIEQETSQSFLSKVMDGVKGVLFDLDGTLVDSMWMWEEIDIEYLGRFGIPLPAGLQAQIEGMSFSETADYFKSHFPAITEDIDEMKQTWNRMAWEKYATKVFLKPGALGFLKYLKEHGIRTGIASSNSAELVRTVLEALNVQEYFDAVHTACEVGVGKPAPDIYLYVAKKLGLSPEHCLVFEDIVKGIESGRAAGMHVCAIGDDYSLAAEEEKRALADYFIEDYRDFGFDK